MADNSNDIENIGTYVKLGSGLNVDLSHGFVEPVKGLFVREAFADVVKQAEPSAGGILGKGTKYVKPASIRSLTTYDVALLVRAIGTSGQLVIATTFNKQNVVVYYNYIRPTAKFAGTVMSAVAVARELSAKGVPWTALAVVYPTAGTRLKKPMVLHVKGIRAYYRAIHTKAGTKYSPEVKGLPTPLTLLCCTLPSRYRGQYQSMSWQKRACHRYHHQEVRQTRQSTG